MDEPFFYDIPNFCRTHAVSRSKVYEEIAAGRLKITKIGKLTRISREAAKSWRELCQAQTRQQQAA